MTKYLKYFFLLLSFLILNSCVGQTNIIKSMANAKKSVLKIETWAKVGECDEELMTCEKHILLSTGSGAVVLYSNQKVVLTAAHICAQDKFDRIPRRPMQQYFKVIDRKNKEYIVEVIKYDADDDICILRSITGDLEPSFVPVSLKAPEYAEHVYNLAAPVGVIQGEMVPIFSGLFFGKAKNMMFGKNEIAFYSIPAIGGSSGSPIFNVKGELVGMVHSVHYRFHHITLSATYERLWNFLNVEHTQIIQCQKQYQH